MVNGTIEKVKWKIMTCLLFVRKQLPLEVLSERHNEMKVLCLLYLLFLKCQNILTEKAKS